MLRILRSMLFVPANNWRMILNALNGTQDAVILDLEDACPPDDKETGRIFARDALPLLKQESLTTFVRVNAMETGMTEEDLTYVVDKGLDGIMLPKTNSSEDVRTLDKLLTAEEAKEGLAANSIVVMPLLETPKGVSNASEIAHASPRVVAISYGAGDYSREIGVGMAHYGLSSDEFFLMAYHCRCTIALAAKAAGILAIDTPFVGPVIDIAGMVQELKKMKLLGFDGKQVIHPSHVEAVNDNFTRSDGEIALAKQLVKTFQEAMDRGVGATTFGGRLIDYASFKRAQHELSVAETIAERTRKRASR